MPKKSTKQKTINQKVLELEKDRYATPSMTFNIKMAYLDIKGNMYMVLIHLLAMYPFCHKSKEATEKTYCGKTIKRGQLCVKKKTLADQLFMKYDTLSEIIDKLHEKGVLTYEGFQYDIVITFNNAFLRDAFSKEFPIKSFEPYCPMPAIKRYDFKQSSMVGEQEEEPHVDDVENEETDTEDHEAELDYLAMLKEHEEPTEETQPEPIKPIESEPIKEEVEPMNPAFEEMKRNSTLQLEKKKIEKAAREAKRKDPNLHFYGIRWDKLPDYVRAIAMESNHLDEESWNTKYAPDAA